MFHDLLKNTAEWIFKASEDNPEWIIITVSSDQPCSCVAVMTLWGPMGRGGPSVGIIRHNEQEDIYPAISVKRQHETE